MDKDSSDNEKAQVTEDRSPQLINTSNKQRKGKFDPRNKLNDLTGTEWIQFTKSWFVEDGKSSEITKAIDLHPASFPPSLIQQFILFFTKRNDWVLDPFLGTGSTLVACEEVGRKGIGIELYEKYVLTARNRTDLEVIHGDCRKNLEKLNNRKQKFHLCITSPPYWNVLLKTKDYNQRARAAKGLDLKYGAKINDVGLIEAYEDFVDTLGGIFKEISKIIAKNGHLVIIVQNIRDKGQTFPLAFDLVHQLRDRFRFLGERIWCQNQKVLRPYGYPFAFVSNVHHHYCLIFKKE